MPIGVPKVPFRSPKPTSRSSWSFSASAAVDSEESLLSVPQILSTLHGTTPFNQ